MKPAARKGDKFLPSLTLYKEIAFRPYGTRPRVDYPNKASIISSNLREPIRSLAKSILTVFGSNIGMKFESTCIGRFWQFSLLNFVG